MIELMAIALGVLGGCGALLSALWLIKLAGTGLADRSGGAAYPFPESEPRPGNEHKGSFHRSNRDRSQAAT